MTTKKHKNNKSYWVEETPEKLSYICETLHNENMKLKDKLSKYKRAFEILKEIFSLDKTEIFGNGNLYFLNGIDSCWEISQEEYELLEELMKGEDN